MITKIDRLTLGKLADDIDAAVQSVAKKHGVQIKRGRGTYGGTFGVLKLEIATIAKDGTVNTREADDFKAYAELYGLQAEDFGKEFESNGQKYTICGLKTRTKYPVLGKRADGKTFRFPAAVVKAKLGRLEEVCVNCHRPPQKCTCRPSEVAMAESQKFA